ncbi:hypothetical protein GW626_10120 [Peribacillus muralis]|uniref:hypothetical protein n=1 Tax=Peribacillus muralis TaxID=264697 RepID=UPI001F4D95BA|nr:hypothetical protein [Peribacillus muralis]MCK1993579.1 hypothetical protein [Peribacillus muralis]MCK2014133.1 hypothetical protein [Peribacillus muralis]
MNNRHEHELTIIDFMTTGHNSCFVKVSGFDAEFEKEFIGEVKFVGKAPFGDLIHPQRSPLSSTCREFVREDLLCRYGKGQFE